MPLEPNSKLCKCRKMTVTKPLTCMVSHVILNLDGTLLNTDGIMTEVFKAFLVKYGKRWDNKKSHKIIGRTRLEAAATIVKEYALPLTTEEFISATTTTFHDHLDMPFSFLDSQERKGSPTPHFLFLWCNIKALPGADRLIRHLKGNRVPMALASNSFKSCIEAKLSFHQGWEGSFSIVIGVDEVTMGKPSPEIFLEAAKRMSVDPSNCLVIEDSLPGLVAGEAAGMEVVAVPSLMKQADIYSSADEVINSLLDLHPEKWGLPPFDDWIEGTLPIEPWYIGGPVIKGFGRGSKVLGIPTANLPAENFSTILSEHTSGVYFGWAGLSSRGIYKMVMSIGWNPYFDNIEKTIEPWLLHNFGEDFYGEELRLAIVGYIRPEANFPSLEGLIARIHEDGRIAEKALDLPLYARYKDSPYLKNSMLAESIHFNMSERRR